MINLFCINFFVQLRYSLKNDCFGLIVKIHEGLETKDGLENEHQTGAASKYATQEKNRVKGQCRGHSLLSMQHNDVTVLRI